MIRWSSACMILLTASVALAQPGRPGGGGPPGGFPGGFGGPGGFIGGGGGGADSMTILGSPEVRKALALTDDQVAFLDVLREDLRDKMRDQFSGMRDIMSLSREERDKKIAELRTKGESVQKETDKQIEEIIGADKFKRFKQIQVQLNGPRALSSPDVKRELAVTDDQQEQIDQAMRKVEEDLNAVRRQKQLEAMMALLTEDQKAKWKVLAGDPIDFDFNRDRRRGGSPGGGDAGGGPQRGGRPGGTPKKDGNN